MTYWLRIAISKRSRRMGSMVTTVTTSSWPRAGITPSKRITRVRLEVELARGEHAPLESVALDCSTRERGASDVERKEHPSRPAFGHDRDEAILAVEPLGPFVF